MVEVGYGDLHITRKLNLDNIKEYTCIDIATQVIEYGKKQNINVIQGDASNDLLPIADLLIIKDVLQHWPNDSVNNFIGQFSRFKEVIIINDLIYNNYFYLCYIINEN